MARHTVRPNQNIFDIALELYGSVEGLFDLLISNESLTMDTDLKAGMVLEYHDYFVINEGIVKSIKDNKYLPANGERHVYFKNPDYELFGVCRIDSKTASSGIIAGGQGNLQIDWGDNSGLETITLSNRPQETIHYFDNRADTRRLKFYGDCSLTVLDVSSLNGDMFLTRPLTVDEYISKSNGYSLKGLFLLEGTVSIDLQGMDISELEPIAGMSLQKLNLLNVRFTDVSVLDNYLQYVSADYGDRRSCTVHLDTVPTERGMQAIRTIINEQSWNETGKWEFIINGKTYTKE